MRVPLPQGDNARVELRSPDNLCNPYVVYALTLLAGMDGMERGLALPPADTPTGDALPDSMQHAAELAAASPFLGRVLPAQTLHAYLTRSPN